MYLCRGVGTLFLTAAGVVLIALGSLSPAAAQTSRIQVVHNSPDPAVEWLSLYLNDIKVADSLLFRNAKPYVQVPSGVGIQAGFAPLNSTSPDDIFLTVTVNLEPNKDYVAVILGVFDANYRPNPDDIPIGLNLLVAETRPLAAQLETSDYLFINGATDAPNLDFRPRGEDPIASGVPYGSAVGYLPYDDYVYTLDVTPTEAPERILGFFDLDVGFLKDKAFTVLTSGFLNKFENGNGPELKVLVVTADGLTQSIGSSDPTDDVAMMQIINNSADLNFPSGFDIYFNGGRAVNNLRFRNATPFFGLPGDATVTIEIKNATGGLTIRSTALTVEPGRNYLLMITGVVNTAQYDRNPDNEPTDLAITINPNIRLFPSQLGVGEFVFVHGITDGPRADMEISDLPTSISGVTFGEMTGYHAISEFNVLMEMVASSGDLPTYVGHRVEIPFVLGRTFVLYAGGFLRPERNRLGEPAQLMMALTDGAIVRLRFRDVASEAARLQLIHASADPAFETADLYVDFALVGDDAPYRSGTPFLDIPAGRTVTVSVAPPESEGVEDAVASFKMQYDEGTSYAGIVKGVGGSGSFASNPEGKSTDLDLHVIEDALEAGLDGTRLTVMAANELTDAPSATVTVESTQQLAQSIGFGEHGDYGIVQAATRFVEVDRTSDGTRIGASYIDFANVAGRAGILVATGFVDPTANEDGPAFSTFLILDDGTAVQAGVNIVNAEDEAPEIPGALAVHGNFPNPFAELTNVVFDLPEPAEVSLRVIDATGRLVETIEPRILPAGQDQTVQFLAKDLPSGLYLYSLRVAAASGTREVRGRMMIVR